MTWLDNLRKPTTDPEYAARISQEIYRNATTTPVTVANTTPKAPALTLTQGTVSGFLVIEASAYSTTTLGAFSTLEEAIDFMRAYVMKNMMSEGQK